jgi:hypothetical protein
VLPAITVWLAGVTVRELLVPAVTVIVELVDVPPSWSLTPKVMLTVLGVGTVAGAV